MAEELKKIVLITGCSAGGIGDALAQEYYSRGHRVFATARTPSKIQHLTELGIDTLSLEVTSEDSIADAVERVSKLTNGRLDILVNNAGNGYQTPLIDADMKAVRRLYEVNLFGLMAVTSAFAPLLIASKGTIINIGSIAGVAPYPWQGYYNASKAAVNLLTDTLRIEMKPLGVQVILVVTGVIKTKFFENQDGMTLKEGSVYMPAREEIHKAMAGESLRQGGMELQAFAQKVVSNSLKRNPTKRHWLGAMAFLTWLTDTFLWRMIWDPVLGHKVNMPAVTRKIQAANKSG